MLMMEQALAERPTSQQVKLEIDRYFELIKDLVSRTTPEKKEGKFNFREAQSHKPAKWSGRKDKVDFMEFSNAIKNWAESLHDEGVQMMEEYEGKDQPIEDDDLDTMAYDDILKSNKVLYTELNDCLTGEPLKFVLNKRRGQGIAAWREIVSWYDPRSQVDKSAAYAKIVNPGKRAVNLQQAVDMMNAWESTVSNYEMRHGQVDDVAKITGLKQILPEQLLDNQFRGRKYIKYNVFRQDVTNYINDKHTASGNEPTPMDVDRIGALLLAACGDNSEGETNDKKDETDLKGKHDNDEMLAAFMQFKGNKGYGKSGGKEGKGPSQNYGYQQQTGGWGTGAWKSGKGGGWSQQPWYQQGKGQDSYQQKAKGDKAGKSKGKGKGMQCFNCKGMGHKSFECPSKPINSLEDAADKYHEDEHDDDEGMWMLMEHDVPEVDGDDVGFQVVQRRKCRQAENLFVVEETKGNWVRVAAGMDSCAAQTVMSKKMFPQVKIEQTDDSRNGKEYTAANGGRIKNEGQKIINFTTDEGEEKKMKVQIAEVTRMLISASKVAKAGNYVSLDVTNPHIKNIKTGRITKLRHNNGIFLLDIWVNTEVTGPVFSRQGS